MGGSSRGEGAGIGADNSNVFGNAERAAKAPGNNPGWDRSLLGRGVNAIGGALRGSAEAQARGALNDARSSVGRAAAGGMASRGPR